MAKNGSGLNQEGPNRGSLPRLESMTNSRPVHGSLAAACSSVISKRSAVFSSPQAAAGKGKERRRTVGSVARKWRGMADFSEQEIVKRCLGECRRDERREQGGISS